MISFYRCITLGTDEYCDAEDPGGCGHGDIKAWKAWVDQAKQHIPKYPENRCVMISLSFIASSICLLIKSSLNRGCTKYLLTHCHIESELIVFCYPHLIREFHSRLFNRVRFLLMWYDRFRGKGIVICITLELNYVSSAYVTLKAIRESV